MHHLSITPHLLGSLIINFIIKIYFTLIKFIAQTFQYFVTQHQISNFPKNLLGITKYRNYKILLFVIFFLLISIFENFFGKTRSKSS